VELKTNRAGSWGFTGLGGSSKGERGGERLGSPQNRIERNPGEEGGALRRAIKKKKREVEQEKGAGKKGVVFWTQREGKPWGKKGGKEGGGAEKRGEGPEKGGGIQEAHTCQGQGSSCSPFYNHKGDT